MNFFILGSLASLFYYIGNEEYCNKGWLLALASLLLSLGAWYFLPFSSLGMMSANLFLYLALVLYNVVSNYLPKSRSEG
jgi:hypothetical protein